MNVLLVGGSSQDGFYLAQNFNKFAKKIFLTFRDIYSAERARNNLSLVLPSETTFVYVIDKDIEGSLKKIFSQNRIDLCYYLLSLNISANNVQNITEKTLQIHKIIDYVIPLNIIKKYGLHTKLYFCLSSRMFSSFGQNDRKILETSEANPIEIYGQTKSNLWREIKFYRSKGFEVTSFILFPHVSTHYKIKNRISNVLFVDIFNQLKLFLEKNSDSIQFRDVLFRQNWSYAGDLCRAMYKASFLEKSEDYVLGSSFTSTIQQILLEVGKKLGDERLLETLKKNKSKTNLSNGTLIPVIEKSTKQLSLKETKSITDVLCELLAPEQK